MLGTITPERRAELLASAKAKQADAFRVAAGLDAETRARMMEDGIVLEFTLTKDEYRVLFSERP